MKKSLLIICLIFVAFYNLSAQGIWTKMNDFPGGIRYFGMGCSINGKGYLGFGTNGTKEQNDMWEYSPLSDTWVQKNSSPGKPMIAGVCWVLNSNIYIGSGMNSGNVYDSFFIFNPTLNSWSVCSTLFPNPRSESAYFTINNKGYVASGYGFSSTNDLWEFDPSTNNWTQLSNVPSALGFRFANGFSFGNKGYIIGGVDQSNTRQQWLFEFDPAMNSWSTKTNLPAAGRTGCSAIGLNNSGYIIGGACGPVSSSYTGYDCWKYDTLLSTWTALTGLPIAESRQDQATFSIGNDIYLIGGDRFGTPNLYLKDVWKFSPFATGILDVQKENNFCIYNYPEYFIIHQKNFMKAELRCEIYNINGQLVIDSKIINNDTRIIKNDLSKGCYIINIISSNGVKYLTQKVVL
jgi:N-acetylneuraminic acid mutarotase